MSELMQMDLTPQEAEQMKKFKVKNEFDQKLAEYEKSEEFQTLAGYGLKDALMANPEVLVEGNEIAYKMMWEQAKGKMNAEMSKQEQMIDESKKSLVETKAPLDVAAPIISSQEKQKVSIDFGSMDIYDEEKMKDVELDLTTRMLIEATRPSQSQNNYGI